MSNVSNNNKTNKKDNKCFMITGTKKTRKEFQRDIKILFSSKSNLNAAMIYLLTSVYHGLNLNNKH